MNTYPTLRKTLQTIVMSLIVLSALTVLNRAQAVAEFTPTECPEAFAQLPMMLDCGLVTVPLEHDTPQRGTLEVAVFRVRATGDTPSPDPLVLLQGGPGGSVDTLVFISSSSLTDILAERDLVFIEQRGNRYSRPFLACETYIEKFLASLANPDADAIKQTELEAVQSCLDEFAAAGIDLAAFDSYENARDIPMVVIDALGYDSYNLYGVSYGSLLAQHVMEVDPRGLRSVILDAVAPRDIDFEVLSIEYGWRAFKRLADACAADEVCANANPDLETTLLNLLERLNAEPVETTVTNPISGEEIQIKLDDGLFAQAVFGSLYDTAALAVLPNKITAAAQSNDFSWAGQATMAFVQPDFSIGVNLAVNCSERAYDIPQPDISPDVPQVFAQALMEGSIEKTESCPLLNVPLIPSEANTPVDVNIPTLLMSGEYDPITPAEYGRRVAEALPQAVHVEFPATAHGALGSNVCAVSIAAAFLNDPTAQLDLSCVESISLRFAIDFDLAERTAGTATFLVPASWTEIEPGAFSDMTATVMLVQEDEGRVLDQRIGELLEGVGLSEADLPIRQEQLGQYTWKIYPINLDAAGIVIFAAGIETDTRTYIMLIQGELDQAQQLEENLLLPSLAAFRGE